MSLDDVEIYGFLQRIGVLVFVHKNYTEFVCPFGKLAILKAVKKYFLKRCKVKHISFLTDNSIIFKYLCHERLSVARLRVSCQINSVLNQSFQKAFHIFKRFSLISRIFSIESISRKESVPIPFYCFDSSLGIRVA